jgi:hypothetical protein
MCGKYADGRHPEPVNVRRHGQAPLVSKITVTGEPVELPY